MTLSATKPTIGRKLWYWIPTDTCVQDKKQAFDATVIFVRTDGRVDLMYTNHYGTTISMRNVELHDPQEDDSHDTRQDHYATWMPYQKQLHDRQITGEK